MKLPGFTAEFSLTRGTRAYRTKSFNERVRTDTIIQLASSEQVSLQSDFIFTDGAEAPSAVTDDDFLFGLDALQ